MNIEYHITYYFGLQGSLLNICCNLESTFGQIKFLELFSYTSGITPLQNLWGT